MVRILEGLGIKLLWFDSLGAKCASIAVETSAGIVIIDPGAAEMQPSYPLPLTEKFKLRRKAIKVIEKHLKSAAAIVITHYHYDHHFLPTDADIDDERLLLKKLLILKNPNKYINESQWNRARLFLSELLALAGESLNNFLTEPQEVEFNDPTEELNIALSKDFGSYSTRRKELLEKGKSWFFKLASKVWSKKPWVEELSLRDGTKVVWGDGRTFEFGDTIIQVIEPWFHGIEYDRTGWVLPLVVKKRNRVIFYSSDLMGPLIEDYAEYIAKLRPDVVILDGPPTYLFPYMLNKINLRRAVSNAITIVNSGTKLLIYDHHLLREKKWRERTAEVFKEARKNDVVVLTAAEYLGRKPLIDELCSSK
ncbi:MAG: MBL fold metallo-hydrolase [Desulfurococcales archaeon]|nr:MBL fold metallo-hydrolase [Desulfurococcales archaeon]